MGVTEERDPTGSANLSSTNPTSVLAEHASVVMKNISVGTGNISVGIEHASVGVEHASSQRWSF
jgi:hypothetical protein